MLDSFKGLFKKFQKKDSDQANSGDAAKERLHMVLMQDRANVSAEYIDLMKQDIIDDIKKYVDVDEKDIDVRLTNQIKNDGSNGAPALYANIPITGIKNDKKNMTKIKKVENNTAKKSSAKNSILGIDTLELLENKVDEDDKKVVKKTTSKKSATVEETMEIESVEVKNTLVETTSEKTSDTKTVSAKAATKKDTTAKAKTTSKTATAAAKKKSTTAKKVESKESDEKSEKIAKTATKTKKTSKTVAASAEKSTKK